ncbi:MAG: hypothetical protein WA116_10565 [Anaerolineaceae bacterium]
MKKKGNIALGIDLILIGSALLTRQFYPQVALFFTWPYWGFALAALLIISAILMQEGGWVIFGVLLAGVAANILLQPQLGGIVWVSILAFLGIGLIISALVDKREKDNWRSGLALIIIALLAFLIFREGGPLPWSQLNNYWPIALIVFGLVILFSSVFGNQNKD